MFEQITFTYVCCRTLVIIIIECDLKLMESISLVIIIIEDQASRTCILHVTWYAGLKLDRIYRTL